MRHRLTPMVGLLLCLLVAGACNPDGAEGERVSEQDEAAPIPAPEADTEEPAGAQESAAARIDEIALQVGAIRGLPVEDPVKAEFLGEEDFVALLRRLQEEGEERHPPALDDETAARLLQALRFLPEDADLADIRDQLLDEGVEGVYVPEDGVFYLRSSSEDLRPYTATVAAHEITHVLQDRAFDLQRLEDIDDGDAFLAFTSVVEGDADLVMQLWSNEHQDAEDQFAIQEEIGGQDLSVLEELPPYVLEVFVFPYAYGPEFVARLVAEGGFEAVDRALQDPPTSSAEIYDPQRYLDGFEPEQIPLTVDPGESWEEVDRGTFSAFDLRQMLFEVAPQLPDEIGGAWTGGTIAGWSRGKDVAVAGTLRFEGPQAAAEACDALPRWYAVVADGVQAAAGLYQGDRDVMSRRCDERDVHLGLAPDPATAAALVAR